MQTAVRLLPAQSITLKRRKHATGMKYVSEGGAKHAAVSPKRQTWLNRNRLQQPFEVENSLQAPSPATVDLTSTVTAGNAPMVTVKMKQTDRAISQI